MIRGTPSLLVGFAAAAALATAACPQALGTIFDLPPPRGGGSPAASRPSVAAPVAGGADTIRPPIERIRDPDSVRALLPRDRAGNIDWVAALRSGVINPRRSLPGRPVPPSGGFEFAFDFIYKGPDTAFDALFPHSAHTEWVACQQCHPRIFAYRNTPIQMGDLFQGKYCAECHGKVSYPVVSGCERCHRRLAMPTARARPEFLGTVTLARSADSSAGRVVFDSLARAVFPHWLHRIRFRCTACHMELFEPRAGANRVTMQAIAEGKACGRCHDGTTAFPATVGTCQRCHFTPAPAAVAAPRTGS